MTGEPNDDKPVSNGRSVNDTDIKGLYRRLNRDLGVEAGLALEWAVWAFDQRLPFKDVHHLIMAFMYVGIPLDRATSVLADLRRVEDLPAEGEPTPPDWIEGR